MSWENMFTCRGSFFIIFFPPSMTILDESGVLRMTYARVTTRLFFIAMK